MAWSADSSYLVSASKDSTIKLWAVKDPKKALHTLPGHEDEVGPRPDGWLYERVYMCLYALVWSLTATVLACRCTRWIGRPAGRKWRAGARTVP